MRHFKLKRLAVFTACFCLFFMQAKAQEASTADSPIWYFLQVTGIVDETAGLVITAEDGDKVAGRPIITVGLAEISKQLWRLELSGGYYVIINKATGKKLDIAYDEVSSQRIAVLSDTPSTAWRFVKTGSLNYLQANTLPTSGTGNYLFQNGADSNFSLTFSVGRNDNNKFGFVSFDQPYVSNDNETAWFTISSAKTGFTDKCLTDIVSAGDDAKFSIETPTANNYNQQWKIVKKNSGALVEFVNRATGNVINTTTIFDVYFYTQSATDITESKGWTINALESSQYEIYTTINGAPRYWGLSTENAAPPAYISGSSLNSAFAWKFKMVDSDIYTSTTAPKTADFRVSTRNHRIYVEGAEQYTITGISGVRFPNNKDLPNGIYIVNVNGKTVKVLVN